MSQLSREPRTQPAAFVAPVLVAALWVGLTWRTGLTYHFLPLAIAAAGPLVAGWLAAPVSRSSAYVLAAWSLAVVALGWSVMVAGGFDPGATFVAGQPGGVPGEVLAFSLLGAALSVLYAVRS
ncbi:MAG: hypothetical protein AB7F65_08730 [Dehalococcoidia bacterium]